MIQTTLAGKWQFIGAEICTGSKTKPTDYVEGMIWEFVPKFLLDNNSVGTIVETTPTGSPIKMEYAYNFTRKLLKIDVYTDCSGGEVDESEVDFYDVIFTENPQIIKLSILNQEGFPYGYFRYVLQRQLA